MSNFRPKLSIDLGTANCLIIKENKGIVLEEPTVVVVSLEQKKIISVRKEAKKLLGKDNKKIVARRPLKNGGISNYQLGYKLLEIFLDKVIGRYKIFAPDIKISIPLEASSVEERALVKALENYGVNRITLIPEPMAAAKGAKLPTHKSTGTMIINMGGGTAEIAIISANSIVTGTSHKGAGDSITEKISEVLKENHNILIGEQMAEKIKIQIGSAYIKEETLNMFCSGKDTFTGEPKTVLVTSKDIYPAIKKVFEDIVETAKEVMQQAPSELIADITDTGIALSGGTSLIKNADVFFTKSLGVPCYVVDDAMMCVVRGLGD